jgi:hypothetical protein
MSTRLYELFEALGGTYAQKAERFLPRQSENEPQGDVVKIRMFRKYVDDDQFKKAFKLAEGFTEHQRDEGYLEIIKKYLEMNRENVRLAYSLAVSLHEPQRTDGLILVLRTSMDEGMEQDLGCASDAAILLSEPQRTEELIEILKTHREESGFDFYPGVLKTALLLSEPERTVELMRLLRTCVHHGELDKSHDIAKLLNRELTIEELTQILEYNLQFEMYGSTRPDLKAAAKTADEILKRQ